MAQLVKLQDYVSRYEKNVYHYQALFMRIKENRRKKYYSDHEKETRLLHQKEFRKRLFQNQMNWATSTVKEISTVEPKYFKDQRLQFLTQNIPDNYFLFYEPVLRIKNALVELDILLVGPATISLIVWMSGEGIWQEDENNRFWKNASLEKKETRLSPLIRLERMNRLIKEWAEPYKEQLSIQQSILAPDAYIDLSNDWRKIQFADKRNFKEWYRRMVNEPAPVKRQQLKFVADLLNMGVTNSLYRKDPLNDESEGSFEGI
ncbi:hypothetical protein [Fictibacillus phosphorivorans]|uniref:hypothetical protein n=1 Tax=Fictibacillus phosphorivorans TaxID=1221500 RepID=UPI00203ACA09|nr:hypothetical protein [Fictibacillus phosphorivorans]MCM3717995.1 hypothetical protein [Fictibacillus phosphorivorans]MCM3775444.1 hypothetical protein [Fictibacillus phosphorivorans]